MKLKMFMDAMQAIENDRKLTKEIVVRRAGGDSALIKAYRKHIEIPDALVRVDISEKTGAIKVFQRNRRSWRMWKTTRWRSRLEDAQRINRELISWAIWWMRKSISRNSDVRRSSLPRTS